LAAGYLTVSFFALPGLRLASMPMSKPATGMVGDVPPMVQTIWRRAKRLPVVTWLARISIVKPVLRAATVIMPASFASLGSGPRAR
jgi:hypothetical protein